ncbi:MAG: hypothetical protein IAE82_12820 [Opitutaceae bacterium]|nr:hypothetical protein [Opitutaceae bacterium]
MIRRRHLAALAFAALAVVTTAPAALAAPVEIVRVWTDYRLGKDYIRLAEIISGRQFTGGSTEHRTQPDSGDGYFFTVRVDRASDYRLQTYTLRLHVIAPDTVGPQTFEFPIPSSKKRGIRLELGITGADWPYEARQQPLAWKIEVVDSSGAVVAEQKSFLWEKPPAAK